MDSGGCWITGRSSFSYRIDRLINIYYKHTINYIHIRQEKRNAGPFHLSPSSDPSRRPAGLGRFSPFVSHGGRQDGERRHHPRGARHPPVVGIQRHRHHHQQVDLPGPVPRACSCLNPGLLFCFNSISRDGHVCSYIYIHSRGFRGGSVRTTKRFRLFLVLAFIQSFDRCRLIAPMMLSSFSSVIW